MVFVPLILSGTLSPTLLHSNYFEENCVTDDGHCGVEQRKACEVHGKVESPLKCNGRGMGGSACRKEPNRYFSLHGAPDRGGNTIFRKPI